MMKYSFLALIIGFILDLIIGDPYYLPHPVRWIGNLISRLEKVIRSHLPKNKKSELFGGSILVVGVLILSIGIPGIILKLLYQYIPLVGLLIESIMCYQILATKCLKVESMKVYNSLKQNNLSEARHNVSMIVGRDTTVLDEIGVTKATVETIAENTSDGIIAPMIYTAIGGATLGFFYKAVNTMDSMVGYKNDKYIYFGRCAAKLDDVINYIPARISAFSMILASKILGYDYKTAYRVYKRDNRNHASPNSAQTEAVCAGALNVQLAGDAYYFGKLYKKPTIGEDIRRIEIEDIKKTNRLLYATAFIVMSLIIIITILKWCLTP